ncbi:piRNA biogenesis protein EXD1 [Pelomyxa schiedti]|nr:piRNA biogenesis protein EXD1 [Pelomyxa schiedti]
MQDDTSRLVDAKSVAVPLNAKRPIPRPLSLPSGPPSPPSNEAPSPSPATTTATATTTKTTAPPPKKKEGGGGDGLAKKKPLCEGAKAKTKKNKPQSPSLKSKGSSGGASGGNAGRANPNCGKPTAAVGTKSAPGATASPKSGNSAPKRNDGSPLGINHSSTAKPTSAAATKKLPASTSTAAACSVSKGAAATITNANANTNANTNTHTNTHTSIANANANAKTYASVARSTAPKPVTPGGNSTMAFVAVRGPSTAVISAAPVEDVFALIETVEQCRLATTEIKKHKIIGVDCEGVNLGRKGITCLIQVATPNQQAFLFDVANKEIATGMFSSGLQDILESKEILKIFHDCRSDSDALFHNCGVTLQNVWDTQIAYAVIERQLGNSTPIPVSLTTLLRKYGKGLQHETKEAVREQMDKDENFWLKRPIDQLALMYASQDVLMLNTVYKQLTAVLSRMGREQVLRLSKEYLTQVRDSEQGRLEQEFPMYNLTTGGWDTDVRMAVANMKAKNKWRMTPKKTKQDPTETTSPTTTPTSTSTTTATPSSNSAVSPQAQPQDPHSAPADIPMEAPSAFPETNTTTRQPTTTSTNNDVSPQPQSQPQPQLTQSSETQSQSQSQPQPQAETSEAQPQPSLPQSESRTGTTTVMDRDEGIAASSQTNNTQVT